MNSAIKTVPCEVLQHFERLEFKMGLESIMLTLTRANKLMQSKKPWELKKQNKMDDVYLILGACIETLRIVGTIMQPIVPSLSSKLLVDLPRMVPPSCRYLSPVLTIDITNKNMVNLS
ncbi:hypothetical protein QYM36_004600 [Artemia franciscana]|uniref:Methionine--tRNA ligase, mitochondrial n=1 Tax=Artemia franciscana TaxID=6661 RepID=A0AA88I5U4_ARTSF|nr:hypothetical protein QYM36_004600 [Artemia franciscana]